MLEQLERREWSRTDENLAMLIDRLDYWLTSEYSQWVTDPDDPDVKRRREESERSGVKPPPVPIITPVALRPPEWADAVRKQAESLREYFSTPEVARAQPGESKVDTIDRMLGGR